MTTKQERHAQTERDFRELQQEDALFSWSLHPPNWETSVDIHHRPQATWSGELYREFGEHRRGPTKTW